MAIEDTYGTKMHTADELARALTDRLGLVFTEHDSYFRGVYFAAEAAFGHVVIQPNAIPGDDGEDDLYAPEHAAFQTLVVVTGPALDYTLNTTLNSIAGLETLAQEVF